MFYYLVNIMEVKVVVNISMGMRPYLEAPTLGYDLLSERKR